MGTMQHNTVTVSGATDTVEAVSRMVMSVESLSFLRVSCGNIQYARNDHAQFTIASSGSKVGWEAYEEHKNSLNALAEMSASIKGYLEMYWISYGEQRMFLREFDSFNGRWDTVRETP